MNKIIIFIKNWQDICNIYLYKIEKKTMMNNNNRKEKLRCLSKRWYC